MFLAMRDAKRINPRKVKKQNSFLLLLVPLMLPCKACTQVEGQGGRRYAESVVSRMTTLLNCPWACEWSPLPLAGLCWRTLMPPQGKARSNGRGVLASDIEATYPPD